MHLKLLAQLSYK